MKLVLQAAYDGFSGYGLDAVDLAIALDGLGVDVTPWPTSLLPGLPRRFLRLLEKDPRGRKDVQVKFAPPQKIKPWDYHKDVAKVGYSMWERSPLAVEDFAGSGWEKDGVPQNISYGGLDTMIVTCRMNLDAFAPFCTGTKLQVVPAGIDPDAWPEKPRDTDNRMRFLMVGMLTGRKDPFALLDAWRELKQERSDFNAQLTLHTLAPGLHPSLQNVYPDVTISQRPLDHDGVLRLYHDHHVYVTTSRGEGNNKPAMEFMATGGTVIATDWSAHQNWLYPDANYAVRGELRQAEHAPDGVQEFYVDRQALKNQLWHCYRNRHEVMNKGEAAAKWMRQGFTWQMIAERFMQSITRVM